MVGQLVDVAAALRLGLPLDHPGQLELAQALGEQAARDPRCALLELAERRAPSSRLRTMIGVHRVARISDARVIGQKYWPYGSPIDTRAVSHHADGGAVLRSRFWLSQNRRAGTSWAHDRFQPSHPDAGNCPWRRDCAGSANRSASGDHLLVQRAPALRRDERRRRHRQTRDRRRGRRCRRRRERPGHLRPGWPTDRTDTETVAIVDNSDVPSTPASTDGTTRSRSSSPARSCRARR